MTDNSQQIYTAAGQEKEVLLKDLEIGKKYKLANPEVPSITNKALEKRLKRLYKQAFTLQEKYEYDNYEYGTQYLLYFSNRGLSENVVNSAQLQNLENTVFYEMPSQGGKQRKTRKRKNRK